MSFILTKISFYKNCDIIPALACGEGLLTARNPNIKPIRATGKSWATDPTKGSERSVGVVRAL